MMALDDWDYRADLKLWSARALESGCVKSRLDRGCATVVGKGETLGKNSHGFVIYCWSIGEGSFVHLIYEF